MPVVPEVSADRCVCIQVSLVQKDILVPITEVREVAEFQGLRPYPSTVTNHLGVVHLGGEVIPVIDVLSSNPEKIELGQIRRVVVLKSDKMDCFALLALSVKKVTLEGSVGDLGGVITVSGKPAEWLNIKDLLKGMEQKL